MRGMSGVLQRFWDDTRGAISIIGAFVLVGVVGVSALALEYGHGLLQKVENQRVADLAAYGGALVYNSSGSSSNATSAATNIAALNGISSGASPSVVSSPTGDGNNAVMVTVTTNQPLMLARVLTTNTTMPVSATAYAELNANAPGCIIALSSSGTGVSLSGGATLSAPACAVASNATVTAHATSNTITTNAVDYNASTAPSPTGAFKTSAGGTPPFNKVTTSDPLSGNSEVSTAKARFNSPFPPTSAPSAPTVSSTGGTVTYNSSSKSGTLPAACSTTSTKSPWTVSCSAGQLGSVTLGGGVTLTVNLSGIGPFTFGTISVGGGSSFTLNNTTSGGTYNFAGTINTGSGSNGLTFNLSSNSTYNMAAGVIAQGSAPISFTAGAFNIGTTSTSPCPAAGYSICVGGSARITFAGASTFALAGGIYQDASGMPATPALSLGYGTTTNSFNIGAASDGHSLDEANGATLFGDATGSGDLFQMAGNLTTTDGTCVAVSAAAEHDINGYVAGAGGLYLGSGIYTVNGYVALGNSSGGDVSNCPTSGTTTGLSALGATLVISGASTVTCGSTTSAFCLGAGYSTVKLTAPTSSSTLGSSTAGLAVIGPQSSSDTGAATFTSGATNTQISGAFYFPNGQVYMSGGATLHDTVDTNACLELIGTQVTLTAGSALGSTCSGLGAGSSGATVSLVQ
jgi:hypothetical protein